jgi:ribosome biogenesis protein YTM1
MDPEQNDGTAVQDNVAVTFFTTNTQYPPVAMPETTYTVPLTTLPDGLAALVNNVLGLEPAVPLDFLVNDEYVTTALDKFMRRRALLVEDILHIEYQPALQTQEGSKLPHDDWVSCVRVPVCGNAEFLVTAAYDHCVRVWNADECLSIGTGHTEAVKAVAVNQTTVVAASGDAPAAAKKGAAAKRRRGQATQPVSSFDFVSSGKDGHLKTWHFDAEKSETTLVASTLPHVDSVDTVDVSPAGDLVATGSWDCAAKVFKWKDLVPQAGAATAAAAGKVAPVFAFTDHARAVLQVRFSPNSNQLLYSAGLDGSVKVWNVGAGQLVTKLNSDHAIQAMAVKPGEGSSDLILTGHTDNRLRLFDARAGKSAVAKTWTGHRQWVYSVDWCWRADDAPGNGNLLVSAGEDSTVRVWDLRSTSSALLTLDSLHTDGVLSVAYAGNGQVASGGKDNKTKTFTLENQK